MREDTHAGAYSFTETIEPLNIDNAACAHVFVRACGRVRSETYTQTLIHHPFLKPPLNPSIEEGERRNRAKKKARQEVE
jgi:hypothetical protein